MSHKATSHQSLDVNDKLAKSEAFVIKYKKQLIYGIVALAIVVGGVCAYIFAYAKPQEQKAQELLGVAMQRYVMTQAPDYNLALKGEGKTPGFAKIADQYSHTDAGNIAAYYAGICYQNLGKTKEAIKYLEKFSPKGDQTVTPQALYALANCYASNKQLDKAVETFKKAAKATDVPNLASVYLLNAGLILENQKKNDEALAIYQEIKEKYPTAPICSPQPQGNAVVDPMIDKYIEKLSK